MPSWLIVATWSSSTASTSRQRARRSRRMLDDSWHRCLACNFESPTSVAAIAAKGALLPARRPRAGAYGLPRRLSTQRLHSDLHGWSYAIATDEGNCRFPRAVRPLLPPRNEDLSTGLQVVSVPRNQVHDCRIRGHDNCLFTIL